MKGLVMTKIVWLLIGVVGIVVAWGVIHFQFQKLIVYEGPSVEDFALFDNKGKLFELYRQKQFRAVVLISYGIGCPISRKALPALNDLKEKYEGSVRFLLIDGNTQNGRQELINEAREFGIQIPILKDETQEILKSLNVKKTGEALIVETKTWKVIYRGPINDRFGYGTDSLQSQNNYLQNSLENFLGNRPIREPYVPSLGCAITYQKISNAVYYNVVEKVIEQKCLNCHGKEGIPPNNMSSYEDLKGWSKMLREVILTEKMPPWEVDGFHSPIRDDLALSSNEKSLIFSWIENGMQEGFRGKTSDLKTKGKEVNRLSMDRYKGDLVFPMKSEITMGASESKPWHYELLFQNKGDDIWISEVDLQFSNLPIIQHTSLLVLKSPLDLSKNTFEPEYSNPSEIYNIIRWSPRKNSRYYLDRSFVTNSAFRIPSGNYLYLEVHFSPTGRPEKEFGTVYLERYKSKENPREIKLSSIGKLDFSIPPNTDSHIIRAVKMFSRDECLLRLGAHMHWRGRGARVYRNDEEGNRKIIYSSRFLFKNRTNYALQKPILVKKGEKLDVEFEYDNSLNNPGKIDYNRSVSFGPDAFTNEMAEMQTYVTDPTAKGCVF